MLSKALIKVACETNLKTAWVMFRFQTQQIENADII